MTKLKSDSRLSFLTSKVRTKKLFEGVYRIKSEVYILLLSLFILVSCKNNAKQFTLLSPEETGIQFANHISENDSINILSFDYVYNGAGIGVGDFNKDGLEDLFFTGNQVSNTLYLNEGNFKFKDVTQASNLSTVNRWCSGVAVVDINNDGLLDIYIAVTSTNNSESSQRENLLYVHQGLKDKVPVFKEMAKDYGINDNGHSENAVFFDYDNDGDLDLYVLTNRIGKYPNLFSPKLMDGSNPNTDRLYENTWSNELGHPVFNDVSRKAGINIEGFGLGINISDINRDGWKDIFVTNDYASNDLLYINQKDGTFSNEAERYFKHTSQSAMGNDVADINNDGLQDIICLDMLPEYNERRKLLATNINLPFFEFSDKEGYTYQYMRNTLQLNNGENSDFAEIGIMAGIAATEWSWTPSLADFDNDGWRDLLITNGFPKDVTDKDFMSFRAGVENLMANEQIIAQIPEVKISNYAYKNKGDLSFEDVTSSWGLRIPSFSSGAVYADLDNDGDLDYVVNNINDPAFVYKNNAEQFQAANYLKIKFQGKAENLFGIGATVEAQTLDGKKVFADLNPFRGYKSTVENIVHFGMGNDSVLLNVTVTWPDGKVEVLGNQKANQEIIVSYADAKEAEKKLEVSPAPIFSEIINSVNYLHEQEPFYDFNAQILLPFKLSRSGPPLAVGDINGDGLDDFFVGGSTNKKGNLFFAKEDGSFQPLDLEANISSEEKNWEESSALFFDADNDGDLDLYVVTGGNENKQRDKALLDRFYVNDGKGNFTYSPNALPLLAESGSCVRAADYDQDGDLDLFVGTRAVPLKYPMKASSFLLRNDSKNGNIMFTDVSSTLMPQLKSIGLITDALWTDMDNDNDYDLLLVGDLMPPTFLENKNKRFILASNTGLDGYNGFWNSVTGADFDSDGDIDYLLGNIGENVFLKGTKEKPAKFYSGDLDNNGIHDIIPFTYFKENELSEALVPYNSKDDVNKMLNITRSRFNTYKEFAKARFDNLLTPLEIQNAQLDELNFMCSGIAVNLGNGKFEFKALPRLVQASPLNGAIIDDFNADGKLDILAVGNNYSYEVTVGQLDASNGFLLMGNGENEFSIASKNGFKVSKDAKALVALLGKNGKMKYLASQNMGELKVFEGPSKGKILIPKNKDNFLSYKINGKTVKRELYWGASYLSQSTRKLLLPNKATEVKLY